MDKNIDWSTAPEGATHYCLSGPDFTAWRDLSEEKAKYWHNGQWNKHGLTSVFCLKNAEFEARPAAPAWNDKGLPPIGAEIEFEVTPGLWWKVKVFALKFNPDESADILFDHQEGWGTVAGGSERIRPIRTDKQIADEKRDAVIAEMVGLMNEAQRKGTPMAAALYHSGFRKQ